MEFKTTTLENGLTIVAEVNSSAKSMAAGFFAKTGSRDETDEVSGVSHFLEHMMFKGTERRDPLEVNLEFDQMGAMYNAFTSEENTVYYAGVLPEFQDALLDLMGDLLRPALRQEDFDMEKEVILDEIARYEDQPTFKMYEQLMASHFAGHPLARNVLGTPESITALKRDDMQDYFDRRYSPGNVTLVGVGNIDWERFQTKADEMCAHWTPFDAGRTLARCPGAATRSAIADPKINREQIGIMSPAPAAQDDSRFAAQLLSTIVGDTSGSRLYYALVEPAIADEANTAYDMLDGTGAFMTFISTDPARATEAVDIAIGEFDKIMKDGFSEVELQAAKNKIASAATLKGELPMGRLTAVGFDWVYRKEYMPLAQQIELLFSMSADDVMAVAREYDLTKVTVQALGPLEKI
ncbi:MAG: insulinase family protein [Phycisphaerales bacterium]|jgi:predicted Zn-dependent peptidase|nr:insulinase family protein [Phycisphaerales bacterium]